MASIEQRDFIRAKVGEFAGLWEESRQVLLENFRRHRRRWEAVSCSSERYNSDTVRLSIVLVYV
jgi:hypothetical protein